MTTEQKWTIAHVCHEANRAYCKQAGDTSHKSWADTPRHIQMSVVAGVEKALEDPLADPFTMHEAWKEAKLKDGWVWGPVKDYGLKTHPNLVPYDELPKHERFKDSLFLAIVDAFQNFEIDQDSLDE